MSDLNQRAAVSIPINIVVGGANWFRPLDQIRADDMGSHRVQSATKASFMKTSGGQFTPRSNDWIGSEIQLASRPTISHFVCLYVSVRATWSVNSSENLSLSFEKQTKMIFEARFGVIIRALLLTRSRAHNHASLLQPFSQPIPISDSLRWSSLPCSALVEFSLVGSKLNQTEPT